jgi:hypothetical protein
VDPVQVADGPVELPQGILGRPPVAVGLLSFASAALFRRPPLARSAATRLTNPVIVVALGPHDRDAVFFLPPERDPVLPFEEERRLLALEDRLPPFDELAPDLERDRLLPRELAALLRPPDDAAFVRLDPDRLCALREDERPRLLDLTLPSSIAPLQAPVSSSSSSM